MTFVEYMQPLRRQGSTRDRVLAALWWIQTNQLVDCSRPREITELLTAARVPNARRINVSDALRKSDHLVERCTGQSGTSGWRLTQSGIDHVRCVLGLDSGRGVAQPAVRQLLSRLSDGVIHRFVEEAVVCVEAGALRAGIVFLWAGVTRTLQNRILQFGVDPCNAALLKHDPKSRLIRRVDDFQYVKEKILLQVAQELGILDKSEKGVLETCLDLRNQCGHPSAYWPGQQKALAFVEDVMNIVWK